jgi:hypothetical protein
MQFADVVFPALDIPERAIRYVLIAALLGDAQPRQAPKKLRRHSRFADPTT